MDLIEPLITGEATGLRPAPGQGYAVVTPAGNDTEDKDDMGRDENMKEKRS